VKLSLRVCCAICVFCQLMRAPSAHAESGPAVAAASEEWTEALERRIDRMLPVLLSSLAAVRREHDKGLVRCFDRAVSGLNSVQKQVSYHADLRYEARTASERARHTRALILLSERAEELARSVETCFTDGVPVKHGETVVEVVLDRL
jgi:hypothetical protein